MSRIVVPDSSAAPATSGRQRNSRACGPSPAAQDTAHAPEGWEGVNKAPRSTSLTDTPPAKATPGMAWSTAEPSMSIAAWVSRSGSSARYLSDGSPSSG
ncbi:hypothetical protein [Corynebacterium appendicis]|uniref:hypothetical protein n=1 Tax=Corynebacterium appendicis TaxID=163202 RepID=UPI0028830243|nr:hypothetical protein [Corynebacterium appendicis]